MDPTLQGAGALLREAEVLLAESLEGLVLGDLHARAHVAVPVNEEGERAWQVLAANKGKRGINNETARKPNILNFKKATFELFLIIFFWNFVRVSLISGLVLASI